MLPFHNKKMDSRTTGRYPNFILVTISLIALFSSLSWWSSSSSNVQLMHELDVMSEQLKASLQKAEICTKSQTSFSEQLNTCKARLAEDQVQLEQTKSVIDELKESFRKTELTGKQNLNLCTVELESLKKLEEAKNSSLEALRTKIKSLSTELTQKNEEIKNLKDAAKKTKNAVNNNINSINDNDNNINNNNENGEELEDDGGPAVNSNHEHASKVDAEQALGIKNENIPANVPLRNQGNN